MHEITITLKISKETWDAQGRQFRIGQMIGALTQQVHKDLPEDESLTYEVTESDR